MQKQIQSSYQNINQRNHQWSYHQSQKHLQNADFYFQKGQLLFQKSQIQLAILNYQKCISFNPLFRKAYHKLAECYKCKQDFSQALNILNKLIELDETDSKIYQIRSGIYFKIGQFKMALADYHKLIELNPKSPRFYLQRGMLYQELKQQQNSINDYTRTIELGLSKPYIYQRRANLYKVLGIKQKVIQDYNTILKIDPTLHWTLLERAQMYISLNQLQKAEIDLKNCIRSSKKASLPFVLLGKIYLLQKKTQQAQKYFEKASEMEQYREQYHLYSGIANQINQNYDTSRAYYERVFNFIRYSKTLQLSRLKTIYLETQTFK